MTSRRAVGDSIGREVQFIVPTGALGNITSGLLAKRMGLPIRLLAATNDNDVIPKFLNTGTHAI